MNLREALIVQSPSLALQREAQAEIARLDSALRRQMIVASTDTSAPLAYWHPSGFVSPTKHNGEWLPLRIFPE